ncbi:glucans biosynthesis glucosyltransferase MdoH [Meridianimarinicoccus roseus]|uniref:Glucans biosynthesis glucosyltransferase H n=1 Tax=Meridianimarinicoccus roseus TaxID=2072018 RepID=A0A2V2LHA8_9RHOB|nr:glucans biosynthesis glucosyltransferase MdoH [Meridianimarinicoccus roseus]PWR02537.1 glucans biosynthesis glucosyltransferase MdoH [Meridianimarinicoccus roseus]
MPVDAVTLNPDLPTADASEKRGLPVRARRAMMTALVGFTCAALMGGMLWIMQYEGITTAEWAMLVPFALTLPWLAIGFWNAVLGLALTLRHDDPAGHVTPQLRRVSGNEPIVTRTAIVMAIRNESAEGALHRFETVQRDLSHSPWAPRFDFHVLSDSSDPAICAREERIVADWQARAPGVAIRYRRRSNNAGFKAGNIAEFVRRCRDGYDYFLPLDADSVMGAQAVLRLVRVMQTSPEVGMLQGLVVGTPSRTLFTRAFQFGMRHGMRSFTLGSAWWQADCGPNWGHNILIRMAPFHDHCLLEPIAGRGPLAGDIMSHDQVEAVLMRRAGLETRVVAEEDESFEDNPPSLPDFIKRELRWCNGNMQYLRLLHTPGLLPLSRVQLALAILMYVSPAAWFAFILMGAALAGTGTQLSGVPLAEGLSLFAVIMTLSLAPKLMGLVQVLCSGVQARRYGGRSRVLAGGLTEAAFSFLVAPAVAFAITLGVLRLMLGSRMTWDAQARDRDRLRWGEAARSLWPQTMAGAMLTAYLAAVAPWSLWFAAPVLAALTFAVPLAVLTTLPALGTLSCRIGLFDLPEERKSPTAPPTPTLRAAA